MRHHGIVSALIVLLAYALFTSACGGDDADALSKEAVTSIPAGDATGSGLSGTYAVTITTTACSGTCLFLNASYCDVPKSYDETMTVVQNDGALEMTAQGNTFTTPLMNGGANADDSFDVGGFGTEAGGQIEITSRATGTISPTNVSGTVNAWGRGKIENETLNCKATYALAGTRI